MARWHGSSWARTTRSSAGGSIERRTREEQPMFVEVAARTHFSFLRGGSSPRALVQRAARLGYDALGIADCDGLYGMVRALEAAEELGVRLVVGCEVALDDDPLSFV